MLKKFSKRKRGKSSDVLLEANHRCRSVAEQALSHSGDSVEFKNFTSDRVAFQKRLEKLYEDHNNIPINYSWGLFTKRADLLLRAWTKNIRAEAKQIAKARGQGLVAIEEESIAKFFDPWETKLFHEQRFGLLDLEAEFHHEKQIIEAYRAEKASQQKPTSTHPKDGAQCALLEVGVNHDDMIFELLSENVMLLLDPCVSKRMWIAEGTGDVQFFHKLADCLYDYVEGPPVGNFNKVKNLLVELERLGLAILSSGKNSEWDFAHLTVKFVIQDIPLLQANDTLRKPEHFRRTFEKWFVFSDSLKKPVQYKRRSHARYRLFDHLKPGANRGPKRKNPPKEKRD
jgi:hypothetical protein